MKIIITERQYQMLQENQKYIDTLLDKINNDGFNSLSIDEKRYLNKFSEHINNGGNPDEFKYSNDIDDPRYGEKFKGWVGNNEITFKFSEEKIDGKEHEFFGELTFGNDIYYGVIVANSNGYVMEYDFYDNHSDNKRLTDVIGDSEHELLEFFNDEVVKYLL